MTVVVNAGDSGVSSDGYAVDGFAATFSGGHKPSLKNFAIERAVHDFLLSMVLENQFRKFPNLRVASVENGAEFLPDLFRKLRSVDRKMRGWFADDPVDWFLHMILPWSVLALLFAAVYARVVRGNMLDTMGEDYIRTARAKGLPERRVVGRHGLRPGLTPVVTLLAIDLALLIGNTVVTETVFNMPGLGNYILVSTDSGDLPGVLAVVVLASFAVAFMAMIADIVYAYLDPRVRYR